MNRGQIGCYTEADDRESREQQSAPGRWVGSYCGAADLNCPAPAGGLRDHATPTPRLAQVLFSIVFSKDWM